MSTEQQCDVAFRGCLQNWHPCIALRSQFDKVTLAKLGPSFRIVSEPFAEFLAGSYLPHPASKANRFLSNTARPQAVDKEACSVRQRRRLIASFDFNTIRHWRLRCVEDFIWRDWPIQAIWRIMFSLPNGFRTRILQSGSSCHCPSTRNR